MTRFDPPTEADDRDDTLRDHLRSALDSAEHPTTSFHIRQALQLLDVE
ncbi:hypothetical protein ACFO0N_12140 [Halobium salinum]|uniref:Uncharacterized protein n=1 Tax=Halobium salinum TaxID=1364940 RepID=A0ABD5PCQ9_9EURY|nr:hypothetical protein [Halobium salinum]